MNDEEAHGSRGAEDKESHGGRVGPPRSLKNEGMNLYRAENPSRTGRPRDANAVNDHCPREGCGKHEYCGRESQARDGPALGAVPERQRLPTMVASCA
jgi:hypothetical protein